MPRRRTFASGILPAAHSDAAGLASLGVIRRLPGHEQTLAELLQGHRIYHL